MEKRAGGIALSAIGVVLLLMGTFSKEWWTIHQSETESTTSLVVRISLRDAEFCRSPPGRCTTMPFTDIGSEFLFIASGSVIYFGSIVAALLAAFAVAFILGGEPMTGRISVARLAVAMFASVGIAILVFVFSLPKFIATESGTALGTGFFLGIAGALFGTGGTALLAFLKAPAAAKLPASPVASPPVASPPVGPGTTTPACPTCAAPMQWVTEHGRWFCSSCRAYL